MIFMYFVIKIQQQRPRRISFNRQYKAHKKNVIMLSKLNLEILIVKKIKSIEHKLCQEFAI